MAQPTTLKGSRFLIQIEDPPASGTFVAPCALATKGFEIVASTNDQNVPDCDDPDAATWVQRVVASLSAGLTGAGTLALESYQLWREWALSAADRKVRAKLDAPGAAGGGFYEMAAVLTTFTTGGNNGELATIDVAIASHGEVTWTSAV